MLLKGITGQTKTQSSRNGTQTSRYVVSRLLLLSGFWFLHAPPPAPPARRGLRRVTTSTLSLCPARHAGPASGPCPLTRLHSGQYCDPSFAMHSIEAQYSTISALQPHLVPDVPNTHRGGYYSIFCRDVVEQAQPLPRAALERQGTSEPLACAHIYTGRITPGLSASQ